MPADSLESPSDGYFEELPESECAALLSTTTVGRIAFASTHGQQLLPINFVVLDAHVYFHTAVNSVLDELAEGASDVAFGVDFHDDLFQIGWSVLVQGSTAQVVDEEQIAQLSELSRLKPWAAGIRTVLVKLTPRHISGRKVSQH
ncbi:MAG: hypothetical protein JWP10_728 [Nocardioidaceae bacterium]|nr:hypothetical protein [Nocardioidaceae bacterium]